MYISICIYIRLINNLFRDIYKTLYKQNLAKDYITYGKSKAEMSVVNNSKPF